MRPATPATIDPLLVDGLETAMPARSAAPMALTDRTRLVGDALLVTVLALILRCIHLAHSPHTDEFFHILAARSWLQDGDLCIANCLAPYTRAEFFTYLVAGSIQLFGDTLVAARIPSVVAGTLWAVAVWWWTARVAGRTAGLAAGLLLAFDPGAIYLSQISRFYALQALLVWVAAIGVYHLLDPAARIRRPWLTGAGIGLMALLALHLQVTTLMAAVAIGAWALPAAWPALRRRLAGRRAWRWGLAALVVLGLLVAAAAVRFGLAQRAWRMYQWSSMWTADERNNPKYFYDFFLLQYGWLWQLLPVAAVVALRRAQRPALFCLTVFAGAFLLHSLSGYKTFRVIYYAVPFFLAVWGIALGAVLPALWRMVEGLLARWLPTLGRAPRRVLAAAAMAVTAVVALHSVESVYLTRQMITASDVGWPEGTFGYRGYASYAPAMPVLRPLAESAAVVVASSNYKVLGYLGRADATISENQMYDGHGGLAPEFRPDWQSGTPHLSRPESMEQILACYPSGLIIVEPAHWRRRGGVPAETADVIEQWTERVTLPRTTDLLAFRWEHPAAVPGASCDPSPLAAARAMARERSRR